MAQETRVLKLSGAQGKELEARLAAEAFEFRPVPHAAFSARSTGGASVVATLYNSGKLVVQGAEPDLFLARYVRRASECSGPSRRAPSDDVRAPSGVPLVGSDETGKGDYFGPLVVAAVRVEPKDRARLLEAGVADSKKLSDRRAHQLAAFVTSEFEHAIELLDPLEYNREHARLRNLNPILAALHGRALRALARAGDCVWVDRFADERLVAGELRGLSIELLQTPRAEREPVVAAASIVARSAFLDALAELSNEYAVDLRKGAGSPADDSAREFVGLHGREALGKVAKLHFKNTAKLGDDHG